MFAGIFCVSCDYIKKVRQGTPQPTAVLQPQPATPPVRPDPEDNSTSTATAATPEATSSTIDGGGGRRRRDVKGLTYAEGYNEDEDWEEGSDHGSDNWSATSSGGLGRKPRQIDENKKIKAAACDLKMTDQQKKEMMMDCGLGITGQHSFREIICRNRIKFHVPFVECYTWSVKSKWMSNDTAPIEEGWGWFDITERGCLNRDNFPEAPPPGPCVQNFKNNNRQGGTFEGEMCVCDTEDCNSKTLGTMDGQAMVKASLLSIPLGLMLLILQYRFNQNI